MRNLRYILLLLLFVTFTGCPYNSEVAIDESKMKIDERLIGKWESKSATDYDYIISKVDERTLKIEKKPKAEGELTTYYGFLSEIKGTRFLNIYEESANPRAYYFYKTELTTSGAKLTLSAVTENIREKFTSSAELKAFFEKYMGLSFFYDKEDEVYIRAD